MISNGSEANARQAKRKVAPHLGAQDRKRRVELDPLDNVRGVLASLVPVPDAEEVGDRPEREGQMSVWKGS